MVAGMVARKKHETSFMTADMDAYQGLEWSKSTCCSWMGDTGIDFRVTTLEFGRADQVRTLKYVNVNPDKFTQGFFILR